MSFFDWLMGRKKSGTLAAQSKLAGRARGASGQAATAAKVSRKSGPAVAPGSFHPFTHRRTYKSKHGYPTHVDAAFDGDEMGAFLLGMWVECRSSWVEAARWEEERQTLTLRIDGKEYDFPADFEIANVFALYGSKGKWYWEQWRGKHGDEEFPLLSAGFRHPPRG